MRVQRDSKTDRNTVSSSYRDDTVLPRPQQHKKITITQLFINCGFSCILMKLLPLTLCIIK